MQGKTRRSFHERLSVLSALQSGWMDGEGEAITATALNVAKSLLEVVPIDYMVGIFPTLEGGVSLESKGKPFFYIDIEPDGSCELTDMSESEVNPAIRRFEFSSTGSTFVLPELNGSLFQMIERNRLHERALGNGQKGPAGREERLEGLLRRVLPYVNIPMLNPDVHSDIMREFVEMRTAHIGHPDEITFTTSEELLYNDEPLLVKIASSEGEGYAVRVPEEECGYSYVVAIPSERQMRSLEAGTTCLRKAMLDPGCLLYKSDSMDVDKPATAHALTGYLSESALPGEGLIVAEIQVDPEEAAIPH